MIDKDKSLFLFFMVFEGWVNFKEKIWLNNIERKYVYYKFLDKGKKVFCLYDLRFENYCFENMLRFIIVFLKYMI